jgi:hypothetical protein
MSYALTIAMASLFLVACGDSGSEADRRGVGAECSSNGDCTEAGQQCLAFKGGYCGVRGCVEDIDCPGGSLCVAHTDGVNYCFLVCQDKVDCNRNRSAANEANCSSSIDYADQGSGKACVPPTGN